MAGRITKQKAEERRVAILGFIKEGLTQQDMASRLGISQPAVHAFMRLRGLTRKSLAMSKAARQSAQWGRETADPSSLAPWQLEVARRTGISPERFAWLCTCPHAGNAKGWRGGASIG
jgi:hypothetical protein